MAFAAVVLSPTVHWEDLPENWSERRSRPGMWGTSRGFVTLGLGCNEALSAGVVTFWTWMVLLALQEPAPPSVRAPGEVDAGSRVRARVKGLG